jgi:hypothetical protein
VPGVDEPSTDVPGVDVPGVEEPTADVPGVEEPTADVPGADDESVADDVSPAQEDAVQAEGPAGADPQVDRP